MNEVRKTQGCYTMPSKRKTRKGGRILGEGLSGVVHRPALQCKDATKTPKGDYVTKVIRRGREQTARDEFANAEKLRAFTDIVIVPDTMCEGPDDELMLFSKYGGQALIEFGLPDDVPSETFRTNLIAALERIKERVRAMNAAKIYHNDISFENVVFNPETNQAYLIDFERMVEGDYRKLNDKDPGLTPSLRARYQRHNELGPDIVALDEMIASVRRA
jgi:predicted Ser/Thr protein kinase